MRQISLFHYYSQDSSLRGGSRTAATSKIKLSGIVVSGLQSLDNIAKCSLLQVAAVLNPLLSFYCSYLTALLSKYCTNSKYLTLFGFQKWQCLIQFFNLRSASRLKVLKSGNYYPGWLTTRFGKNKEEPRVSMANYNGVKKNAPILLNETLSDLFATLVILKP